MLIGEWDMMAGRKSFSRSSVERWRCSWPFWSCLGSAEGVSEGSRERSKARRNRNRNRNRDDDRT